MNFWIDFAQAKWTGMFRFAQHDNVPILTPVARFPLQIILGRAFGRAFSY